MYAEQIKDRIYISTDPNRCIGDVANIRGFWVAYHYATHGCLALDTRAEALEAVVVMENKR